MRPLTKRQEQFCLLIVKGESYPAAYTKAGYKATSKRVAEVNASNLLKTNCVSSRIAQLRDKAANKAIISVEMLTKRLLDIDKAATADGQHAAATGALALAARLNGLLVDQKQVDIVHHKPAKEPIMKDLELSEDEWLRLYKPQE